MVFSPTLAASATKITNEIGEVATNDRAIGSCLGVRRAGRGTVGRLALCGAPDIAECAHAARARAAGRVGRCRHSH